MHAVGGIPDHVHLLIRYRADLSSDMIRHVKSRSSKWINESNPAFAPFSWQEGYGGFTVSKSNVPAVEAYIRDQKSHHRERDFQTEFLDLLRLHGLGFDEREVFV